MRAMQIAAIALTLGLASTAAASGDAKKETVGLVQLDVEESAAAQLTRVEQALGTDEYSEISTDDKSLVQAAIGRIRSNLGDNDSPDQANPDARTSIYNDQEQINTILSRAHADSRMICRRERPVGSNRPMQICMTVAQRRELAENSKDVLRNYNRVNPRELK